MFLQYPGHFSIWFFCHFKNLDKKTLSFLSKIPKLAFKYRKKTDDKNKQIKRKKGKRNDEKQSMAEQV